MEGPPLWGNHAHLVSLPARTRLAPMDLPLQPHLAEHAPICGGGARARVIAKGAELPPLEAAAPRQPAQPRTRMAAEPALSI